VELDKSAEKCVLCNTAVLNPNDEGKEKPEPPFARESHIPKSTSQKFVAYVISMVMLIPNIVCLIFNATIFHDSFWSLYVFATSFLVWIIFVFPFFTKKRKPYLMWALDTATVLLYFYFFYIMNVSQLNWFSFVALPVVLTASLQMLVYMLWAIGKKRHIILKTLHLFIDFAIFALISGLFAAYGLSLEIAGIIGVIVFVSCLCIVAFLVYCYNSKSMRRYLSKRFFT
jgi:hypothetical protein